MIAAAISLLANRRLAYHLKRAETLLRQEAPYAATALEASRRAGGLSHSQQYIRLLDLTHIIDKYQPTSVLELGTGTTTAVFAHMLSPVQGAPAVLSLEESEHWQSIARRIIPDQESRAIEFRLLPRVLEKWGEQLVARYDFTYDREYDLVYVDGPSNQIPGERRPREKLPWSMCCA